VYYYILSALSDKNKLLMMETSLVILLLLLLSSNIIVGTLPSKSTSGQEEQDTNLSFIRNLNSSSYAELVEDERFVHEIASAVREAGNAIISNSSLCSVIDDKGRCDIVALSLTSYLSDYNFEDAISKIDRAKERLADFQQNPVFETLDGFAKANSDVAKSLYELLIKTSSSLERIANLPDTSNNGDEAQSSTSTLSIILIEAGRMTNNDSWISYGERLMTVISNFEQKYSEINAITDIVNSVDVNSLPRNEFGFYPIGFGIASILIAVGIFIQLLLRRKKQNKYGI
jgi:hypothetical protein